MIRPSFTLVLCTSSDGFIARHPGDHPGTWASAEEQAGFLAEVAAADWSVMGRATHEVADRPDRRRIIFSTGAAEPDWRRPSQLWVNPARLQPTDLAELVHRVRPMQTALILGGTRVHDWFLDHRAIDRVLLTVEPVAFGTGLPVFTGQRSNLPLDLFSSKGFAITARDALNDRGTTRFELRPFT